jgi:hypothetical protein
MEVYPVTPAVFIGSENLERRTFHHEIIIF